MVPFEIDIETGASRDDVKEAAEREVLGDSVEASDIDVHDWL